MASWDGVEIGSGRVSGNVLGLLLGVDVFACMPRETQNGGKDGTIGMSGVGVPSV
jgi:hypothetical protein